VSGPTPLLDVFKRGDVARDARLLAAQGLLAPRAHEQLAILVLLLDDPDVEVRTVADATLNKIPVDVLRVFLARSDVPIGLREFFADRGVFPAEIPTIVVDEDQPLIDTTPPGEAAAEDEKDEDRASIVQRLANMGFTERLKAAVKGTREMRAILIRDPNRMICTAVLSSPKVTDSEAASFARMASVSEDVLRAIGSNRAWMKSYNVVLGLTKNPKTPLAMSLNLMQRLQSRDISTLSVDRNVPEPLRIAARKKALANASGKE
jgi:hypothetical protein